MGYLLGGIILYEILDGLGLITRGLILIVLQLLAPLTGN